MLSPGFYLAKQFPDIIITIKQYYGHNNNVYNIVIERWNNIVPQLQTTAYHNT